MAGDLLATLREALGRTAAEVPGLPPFTGGAVGYLAYDAVRLFERLPDRHPQDGRPLASFSIYHSLVAFDHVRQRLVLIADVEPGRRAAFERGQEVLDALEEDLRAFRPPTRREGVPSARRRRRARATVRPTWTRSRRAKEYIAAGDIFQVVLSRQRTIPCALDPFTVYRALRMVNPSPYMFFLKEGATAVAGASPEMLVRVEGRRVETRPLAGTRPRGATAEEDAQLENELLADEKERAEHLMLVDLGRNDLGRVCSFGSVSVPELMRIERYSHVAHIVSSVIGELAPGKDALDALVATFPAGTLSGAPKIRAMEIIDELEPVAPRPVRRRPSATSTCAATATSASPSARCCCEDGRATRAGGGGDRGRLRSGGGAAGDRGQGGRDDGSAPRGEVAVRRRARRPLGPARRQLRLVHLQPLPVPRRAGGGDSRRAQRRARPRTRRIALGARAHRDLARPRHARTRRASASSSSGAPPDAIPLLGVCLGPSGAGPGLRRRGACARRSSCTARRREIHHDGRSLFAGLPVAVHGHALPLAGGRRATSVPECLEISAWTDDGIVMGLRHRELPAGGRAVPPGEHPHHGGQGPAAQLPGGAMTRRSTPGR